MEEYYFLCPYCGQRISMLIDLSVPAQAYIEDCEVCCRPVEIRCTVDGSRVQHFDAQQADA